MTKISDRRAAARTRPLRARPRPAAVFRAFVRNLEKIDAAAGAPGSPAREGSP